MESGLGNHGVLCGSHSHDQIFLRYSDMISVILHINAYIGGALTDLDCPIASLKFVILTATSASFYDSRVHSEYLY